MTTIKYFISARGASPFEKWFNKLDGTLQQKVTSALDDLTIGRRQNMKPLGDGLSELKFRVGGGLRIYFAEDGDDIILLLGGGKKDDQSREIDNARNRLADYLERKEEDDEETTDR